MRKTFQITMLGCLIMGYANANSNNQSLSTMQLSESMVRPVVNTMKQKEKKRAFKAPPDILANKLPKGVDVNLLGKITNKYVIRDDILAYIEQTIPADNKRAREATIRKAQYMRETEFNQDPDQAREYLEWSGNASWCLGSFIGDRKSYEIDGKLDKFYRDTKERKVYSRKRDVDIFGWHVFSTTIGNLHNKPTQAINEFCLSGGKYWE